jgi:hypothetical protein
MKRLLLALALTVGLTSLVSAQQLQGITGMDADDTYGPIRLNANSFKSIYGQVVGTGAVTQTQAIYGDIDDDAANGALICTITLTDTSRDQAACSVITSSFTYYYVVTTNTTGTGATGAVYFMY